MALSPRDHVLLLLRTGDRRYRHCVVLDEANGVEHHVLTPSRQVRKVDFSSQVCKEIVAWDGVKLPRGVGGKTNCFLDVDHSLGKFTKSEIDEAVAELASRAPVASHRRLLRKQPIEDGSVDVGRAPRDLPLRGGGPVAPAVPRLPSPPPGFSDGEGEGNDEEEERELEDSHEGQAADGEGWYLLTGYGSKTPGSPVDLSGKEMVRLGELALFRAGPATGVAFWSVAEKVASTLRRLQIRCSPRAAHLFEGVDDVFYDPSRTPRGEGQMFERGKDTVDAEAQSSQSDVRVLEPAFETDGRRFMKLSDAEILYSEEVFDDWPLDTERTISRACRELRRGDMTWLTHHTAWVRDSGVRHNDRSVHEHRNLCTALHHLATYDQLHLPNICGAEVLNGRRELIENAHEGHPEAPRWDGADEFLGYKSQQSGTLIDPRKVAFVANRQAARSKILETSLKAKESAAAWARRGQSGNDEQGDGGKKEKKGKGEQKGGRGAGAAASAGDV